MEIPRHWRLKAQRYRLVGISCPTCGHLMFPPRPVCPHCTARLGQIVSWILLVLPNQSIKLGLNRILDCKSWKG
jgi:hypothetical protein